MGAKNLLPPNTEVSCDVVDALPASTRALVHEFGYSVVRAFDMAGVRDPRVIRRLIHAVWLGAREPGNKPANGGTRLRYVRSLNAAWPQLQNAEAMIRFLRTLAFVPMPIEPSPEMIQASMDEMGNHGIVSKEMKHRLRLRAAIRLMDRNTAEAIEAGADG